MLIGALVCATGWAARYNVRDNVRPRNFGVVAEGKVYRSGRLTPAATQTIVQAHGIRTIVDLGAYAPGSTAELHAQRTAEALGVNRFRFSLEGDGTGEAQQYVHALRIIGDARFQPVLVHCAAGSERTSACIMMYRELHEAKPWRTVYDEALSFKHEPEDNPHMRPYLEQWAEKIIRAVREGKDLPSAR